MVKDKVGRGEQNISKEERKKEKVLVELRKRY